MADTGWKNPSAEGLVDSEWGSPTNAYTSDDSRANPDDSRWQDEQDYYNFSFGIPAPKTTLL